MGRRGPPKKPTTLKLLEGNRGKRKLSPESEPAPDTGMPTPPSYLSKAAKQEWFRLAPELNRIGLLTKIDPTAFAAYCTLYGQFERSELIINNPRFKRQLCNGGQIVMNPELGFQHKTLVLMKNYLHEFGLTPSARSGMHVTLPTAGKKEDDLDDFISSKKA